MSVIISFDLGTTSCRAIAFDTNAKILAQAQQASQLSFPQADWVEQDGEEIWQQQLAVFEQLLAELKLSPDDILAIGITNQRESCLIWDKATGQALTPVISWQDKRTQAECRKIRETNKSDWIKRKTGLIPDAYFSATKLAWLLDNDESLRQRADNNQVAFGTLDSWLVWKMSQGKQHITDVSNASRTMLFNIESLEWDHELLSFFNIPKSILPSVVDSSGQLANFEYQGSQIPICGIAGDQQAALFGQACFDSGQAKNTYGTGCFLLANIGSELKFSQHNLLTTLAWRFNGETYYAFEGSVFIAGAAIEWLINKLDVIASTNEIQALITQAKPSSEVVFVPAFVGLGAPYWQSNAKAAVFGLGLDDGKAELTKACIESLALQSKDLLDAMISDLGSNLTLLNIDGGAVRNKYLVQFQADILANTQVKVTTEIELTAIGAAYLAGLGCGLWQQDQLRVFNQASEKQTYTTNMTEEKRQSVLSNWRKAIDALRLWAGERS
ncbi:glycerol kinase GlpK [Catenovulum maritimum]|uniref:ATP:glycerol 3-phosphotransferase n=1 Tax=Catenovulum maritimum TaxID=1513271 RepID=A0A0J8GSX3_9ALTE|nr:glycerol kinase GlpK [Catenovulum maritimum]KMT64384.1 hypothetical protein XM47_14475 [Catenovulum maritimum]